MLEIQTSKCSEHSQNCRFSKTFSSLLPSGKNISRIGDKTLFSAVYYYKLETALENYDQYFIEKPTKLLEHYTGFNSFHTSSTLNQCNKVLQQHLALPMPD